MNSDSENLLLLSARLGSTERRPLTQAQLKLLMQRMRLADLSGMVSCMEQLSCLGLDSDLTRRIWLLLQDRELLCRYLSEGEKRSCIPLTIMDAGYPSQLRRRLGDDAPPCLWLRGDSRILDMHAVALVGSRELREENRIFAREAGIRAAEQGCAIVSGNARGADLTAQQACLDAGGAVVSVISDILSDHPIKRDVLYVSEEGWDEGFSAFRALHRNYTIHSYGSITFAAQCTYGKGGTWSGCCQNLKKHWTPLFCFRDDSPAFRELEQRGAVLIESSELADFTALTEAQMRIY